jgi:hypothetical protein
LQQHKGHFKQPFGGQMIHDFVGWYASIYPFHLQMEVESE